jgi:hypothetical protein
LKKAFVFLNVFLICLLGCTTSTSRSFQPPVAADGVFSFSEMYFSHNLISGETEIILYNIPLYFNKYREENTPKLYDDYFYVEEFAFKSESFNDKNGYLTYRLLITAKAPLLQNKNMIVLLSKISQKEVGVGYIENSEMTKGVKRPWTIVFPYKENMYFGDKTNAVSSYQNKENALALLLFDLNRRIEFVLGYK